MKGASVRRWATGSRSAREAVALLPGDWLLIFLGLYVLAFALWIVARPVDNLTYTTIDDLGQAAGPLAVAAVVCTKMWTTRVRLARLPHAPHRLLVVPSCLLVLGVILNAAGQLVYTYQSLVDHSNAFPSIAHVLFLSAYPCFAVALGMFLFREVTATKTVRIGIEALLITLAVCTFAWYFILGPLSVTPHDLTLAWVVGLAFPVGDLLVLATLVLYIGYSQTLYLRPAAAIMVLGFVVMIGADGAYDYAVTHAGYTPGSLIDVCWPLGYMLIAFGVSVLWQPSAIRDLWERRARDTSAEELHQTTATAAFVWSLIPYALLAALGMLIVWDARFAATRIGDPLLDSGMHAGVGLFVLALAIHQVIVLWDSRQLHRRVKASHEQLQTMNERLDALASYDPLTGLANRRLISDALDRQVSLACRHQYSFAVIFVDIDHFKWVNDRQGHLVGDTVLRAVGRLIQEQLRTGDLVGRWGGEEFVAILPETDARSARATAERVRRALAGHELEIHGARRVTCSAGVAVYPDEATGREELIERADQAMYAAKAHGRNRVCSWSEVLAGAAMPSTPPGARN